MKRAAIVGLGVISPIHRVAITANPNIQLCAVCDIDESKKADYPGVPFYTDYRQMLAEQKPDVVHICLPHYLHLPAAKTAVEMGCHVFCEKPVALTAAEAREFTAFEAANPQAKIGICLQNRLNRTTVVLKQLIESGEYGKVIGCRGFVPWQRTADYYAASPWRGRMAEAGGGCMINQSVHTLDLLYYLCGEMTAIHGAVNQLLDAGIEVEDTVTARLEFASGAKGFFFATNCNYANESVQIKVVCEKGSFLIEDDALWKIAPDASREKLCENEKLPGAKFYFGASHGKLIDKFYQAVEDGTDDYIHVRDAEMSIRLIDAIRAGSAAGAPVAP